MYLLRKGAYRHISHIILRGGLSPKTLDFFHIFFYQFELLLLANSKVFLELLDAPFHSYDGFCPCIDLKIQRETTWNTSDER